MSWKEDLLDYFALPQQDVLDYLLAHPTKEYMVSLSPARFNFLAWYPFNQEMKVLEINGGCGAITQGYIDRVDSIDLYDEDPSLLEIAKIRFKDHSNIVYYTKLQEKQYDLVILTGKINQENIDYALNHSKKVVIAFDNLLGLARLAGNITNEDTIPYESLYQGIGMTKEKICNLLDEYPIHYHFYYPYPDYYFASEIYSDHHLPKLGDLIGYSYDYSVNKVRSFDEVKVRDLLIQNDQLVQFMNSYIVEVNSDVVL